MKISLVVAQGVHSGKVIPIGATQFLIGRDPHCNLRPASPSISKQHCGIFAREGKVFLKDYGSTNGTSINGAPVEGEVEVADGDLLKIGPLEFKIAIEQTVAQSTVKAPPPAKAAVASFSTASELPVAVDAPSSDDDSAAAMLLSMDDTAAKDPTGEAIIPEGSTVMDIPSVDGAKPDAIKKIKQEQADTSQAARDLLSKYMRRPRT